MIFRLRANRQVEVPRLIIDGCAEQKVTDALGASLITARADRYNIKRRLGTVPLSSIYPV